MKRLDRILVGVDLDERGALTEGSACAARHALQLAGFCEAKVDFIHSAHRSAEDAPAHTAEAFEVARAELAELGAASGMGTPELFVADETPALALIHRVLSHSYGMVVVAKRNLPRRDDRKLGSVSMQLIRMCPSPVWVIKPGQEMAHKCIVAATDLSPVGDLATNYGALIASREKCDLFVVHAWQVPLELQMSHARIGDEEFNLEKRAIADAALQHIRSLPAIAELGERVKVQLANDRPSRVILEVVRKQDPDLVVLGTISRGGIAGLLIGNTAEKLVYELDCSLLAVKPDDFISPVQ